MLLSLEHFELCLTSACHARNLPGDVKICGAVTIGSDVGLLVHSQSFPVVPTGEQLPTFRGVIERRREAA
jgi:hypothetical protein